MKSDSSWIQRGLKKTSEKSVLNDFTYSYIKLCLKNSLLQKDPFLQTNSEHRKFVLNINSTLDVIIWMSRSEYDDGGIIYNDILKTFL